MRRRAAPRCAARGRAGRTSGEGGSYGREMRRGKGKGGGGGTSGEGGAGLLDGGEVREAQPARLPGLRPRAWRGRRHAQGSGRASAALPFLERFTLLDNFTLLDYFTLLDDDGAAMLWVSQRRPVHRPATPRAAPGQPRAAAARRRGGAGAGGRTLRSRVRRTSVTRPSCAQSAPAPSAPRPWRRATCAAAASRRARGRRRAGASGTCARRPSAGASGTCARRPSAGASCKEGWGRQGEWGTDLGEGPADVLLHRLAGQVPQHHLRLCAQTPRSAACARTHVHTLTDARTHTRACTRTHTHGPRHARVRARRGKGGAGGARTVVVTGRSASRHSSRGGSSRHRPRSSYRPLPPRPAPRQRPRRPARRAPGAPGRAADRSRSRSSRSR